MTPRDAQVLLVEDGPEDSDLTLQILRRENMATDIQVVRDGNEALDFLFCRGPFANRRLDDLPALILLDVKRPKVNGIEVLCQIKGDERTKVVPVVILTSCQGERDLLNSYDLGVNSYIQKPVDLDQLRETVKRIGRYWLVTNQPPAIIGAAAKIKGAP
jgi:CheY-like chemotaxis protein